MRFSSLAETARSAIGTSGRRRRTRSMAALTAIVRTHAVNDDWWR